MKWIHIDFWFYEVNYRTDAYLTIKEQRDFESLIALFLRKCGKLVKRKFYLYEDIPHCFLALEIDNKDKAKIDKIRQKIFVADYIYKTLLNDKAGSDKGNGEGFLDIINAFTDFYLFKCDNRITHIIHCCMEFMMQSRQSECEFYQNMAMLYQVVTVNKKKVVYGLKRFTPQTRKKLKNYINQLDLRK
jgi:hypothetical protein